MTSVEVPAVERRQVAAADALRVFISSRMSELAPERAAVRDVLAAAGYAPWLYEVDAGAGPGPPRQTYLDALYNSDVYLGLFWKTQGAYTVDEFDAARRSGVACLIYEKIAAQREPELSAFLNRIGHVEEGVTIRRFRSPEELGQLVSHDVTRVQGELIRVQGTNGRTYTGSRYGGRFDLTARATPMRRHPLQASNGPRPPDPFVDRNDVVDRLKAAIGSGESLLGVSGVPGIGKTSVLRRVAHDPNASIERYPDGVGVYIEGEAWPRAGDLLRALWSELYRVADHTFVPDDAALRADLQARRALVFVDGVRLRADEVDRLRADVPGSTFVLTSDEAKERDLGPLAYTKAVPLTDFEKPADIVALFGARYGQEVPSELADAVVALCRRDGTGPGMITKLAHEAWGSGLSLAGWLGRKQETAADPGNDLSEDDHRVLGILAAFGPDLATPGEMMMRLGVSAERMTGLMMSGHVIGDGPAHRLAGVEYLPIVEAVDLEAIRGEIFEVTVQWIAEAAPRRLEESRAFILRVLEWGVERDRHRGVLLLAMALAPHLAVMGAWDSWGVATNQALRSARSLGAKGAEAWALHEAGTRQLMLGNKREARRSLRGALRLRRRAADMPGAAISTHNLGHTGGFATTWRRWAVLAGAVMVIGVWAQTTEAGAVLDFGEVATGSVSHRYQTFSNEEEELTVHRIEIVGDPAFCVVAPEGPICSAPGQPAIESEPVADGPEVPECRFEQVEPADALVRIRVEPESECALWVTFAPILDFGETRREAQGELRITTDEGEETIELTGVGVRLDDAPTTTAGATTTTVESSSTTTIQQNRPPTAADDFETVSEGSSVLISVLANDTDPDSDDLNIEIVRLPENGDVTLNPDGAITYRHNGSESSEDSFTYQVSDGEATSNEATVTIEVSPVNDRPLAVDDQETVNEGGQVRIAVLANDSDPEDDPLTIVAASAPAHGSVEIMGDVVLYSHDDSATTSDSFDYTVVDGNGGTTSAQVTIEINPVNAVPIANPGSTQVSCNSTVPITLTGSDADGDPLQFTIIDGPEFGTLSAIEKISDTEATVDYTAGNAGNDDVFVFQVDDGRASGSASIEINGFCIF
ncbi:MAG TPA: Ig-like domain-containing protein [Acidimicrobiia bacterium]|nr:Ig-like domain-containing protein [Acidimicrobiia bacterium]